MTTLTTILAQVDTGPATDAIIRAIIAAILNVLAGL